MMDPYLHKGLGQRSQKTEAPKATVLPGYSQVDLIAVAPSKPGVLNLEFMDTAVCIVEFRWP